MSCRGNKKKKKSETFLIHALTAEDFCNDGPFDLLPLDNIPPFLRDLSTVSPRTRQCILVQVEKVTHADYSPVLAHIISLNNLIRSHRQQQISWILLHMLKKNLWETVSEARHELFYTELHLHLYCALNRLVEQRRFFMAVHHIRTHRF